MQNMSGASLSESAEGWKGGVCFAQSMRRTVAYTEDGRKYFIK